MAVFDPSHPAATKALAAVGVPFLRHIWLVFVLLTSVNAAIWWCRGQREIDQNPALAWGFGRLIWKLLIFANIPWLILGAALELHYALPAVPPLSFFIAFLASILLSWLVAFYWLFFRGGAEALAAYPGVFGRIPRDPRDIKKGFLYLLGGLIIVSPMMLLLFF